MLRASAAGAGAAQWGGSRQLASFTAAQKSALPVAGSLKRSAFSARRVASAALSGGRLMPAVGPQGVSTGVWGRACTALRLRGVRLRRAGRQHVLMAGSARACITARKPHKQRMHAAPVNSKGTAADTSDNACAARRAAS